MIKEKKKTLKDETCFYCTKKGPLNEILTEIVPLGHSTVYFFNDQKNPGRCVVAFRDHYRELHEIPDEECDAYLREVRLVAKAIANLYHPDKINYALYGDLVSHVHFHVVPKYAGGVSWGQPFNDTLPKIVLDKREAAEKIEELRREILHLTEA